MTACYATNVARLQWYMLYHTDTVYGCIELAWLHSWFGGVNQSHTCWLALREYKLLIHSDSTLQQALRFLLLMPKHSLSPKIRNSCSPCV